jgi:peptidoglycan/xylan/chitin deacetylase (PgdA/CDA1 family)
MHLVPAEPSLTIVMYHYVRDLPRTQYPNIKGLLTKDFEGQLDHIARHYSVCGFSQVRSAMSGQCQLPTNPCILTFDDGLNDHYETVMPRLIDRGWTGAFFPPARAIDERRMLDVHKIQFILASVTDYAALMDELLRRIDEYRESASLAPADDLIRTFAIPNRFDSGPVMFVKKMLQWVLPAKIRSEITGRIFAKYVSLDETAFADQLYLTTSQLREMASCGMEIGGHGYNHDWLGTLSREAQIQEIEQTAAFLGKVLDRPVSDWVMCYPFGSYNADTLQLVSQMGCKIGLTTKVGLANLARPLELERVDTNDLPVA